MKFSMLLLCCCVTTFAGKLANLSCDQLRLLIASPSSRPAVHRELLRRSRDSSLDLTDRFKAVDTFAAITTGDREHFDGLLDVAVTAFINTKIKPQDVSESDLRVAQRAYLWSVAHLGRNIEVAQTFKALGDAENLPLIFKDPANPDAGLTELGEKLMEAHLEAYAKNYTKMSQDLNVLTRISALSKLRPHSLAFLHELKRLAETKIAPVEQLVLSVTAQDISDPKTLDKMLTTDLGEGISFDFGKSEYGSTNVGNFRVSFVPAGANKFTFSFDWKDDVQHRPESMTGSTFQIVGGDGKVIHTFTRRDKHYMKVDVTGFPPGPWTFRYAGREKE